MQGCNVLTFVVMIYHRDRHASNTSNVDTQPKKIKTFTYIYYDKAELLVIQKLLLIIYRQIVILAQIKGIPSASDADVSTFFYTLQHSPKRIW